jgi:hypothetical protein
MPGRVILIRAAEKDHVFPLSNDVISVVARNRQRRLKKQAQDPSAKIGPQDDPLSGVSAARGFLTIGCTNGQFVANQPSTWTGPEAQSPSLQDLAATIALELRAES